MKKTVWTGLLAAALCLLLFLPAALAETREGVIELEGQKEAISETLYQSEQGFSFWYADERLNVYAGEADGIEGVVVESLYSDGYMVLSMIGKEDALEYTEDLGQDIIALSAVSHAQTDVYRLVEDGRIYFLTLVAENGQYLRAVGEYSEEAAEGYGKFFQRVLDSVFFPSADESELLRELPGEWAEETEGIGTALTFDENGTMTLAFYGSDGEPAYSYQGSWSLEHIKDYGDRLTLLFTWTDNPLHGESDYRVECVYEAYTESWIENDTEYTYLLLNPPVSCSGVSPFEEVTGSNDLAVHREQGPNMRVVKCKEFVSLRQTRSTKATRLAKVPLGAQVLAFPEAGEENGFISCVYQGEEGYILAEYLEPIQ